MEKINLRANNFTEDLFWKWSRNNLYWSVHNKLRYESFKNREFCEIRYRFENIR